MGSTIFPCKCPVEGCHVVLTTDRQAKKHFKDKHSKKGA
jgi:hypothetical protein